MRAVNPPNSLPSYTGCCKQSTLLKSPSIGMFINNNYVACACVAFRIVANWKFVQSFRAYIISYELKLSDIATPSRYQYVCAAGSSCVLVSMIVNV